MATTLSIEPIGSPLRSVPIVTFANGKIHNKSEDASLITYKRYKDQMRNNKKLLVAHTERLSYVGYEKEKESSKQYVGVLDKRTGKMRIYDGSVFVLSPKFEDDETNDAHAEKKTNIEKRNMLVHSFGSASRKRVTIQRDRLKVTASTLKETTDRIVDNCAYTEEEHKAQKSADIPSSLRNMLPPADTETRKRLEIYKLHDIISESQLEILTNDAQVFFDCKISDIDKWKDDDWYRIYVLNHLYYLPCDESEKWLKCKLLMYLYYLIELYRVKPLNIDPLPAEWNNVIKEKMYQDFSLRTTNSRGKADRAMPARLRDKLLCYILILALHIDNFEVPVTDLCQDLKLPQSKLKEYFRYIGCTISNIKKKGMAKLKCPITFPREGFNKKRR